jgi:hypothetical protein
MNTPKLGEQPAFPVGSARERNGLSKREHIATAVLSGLVNGQTAWEYIMDDVSSGHSALRTRQIACRAAVDLTETLLAELEKERT